MSKYRGAGVLAAAVVMALLMAFASPGGQPVASAAEPLGGVVALTASGKVVSGAAAAELYEHVVRGQKGQGCISFCPKGVILSGPTMPFIVTNIYDAFSAGTPSALTKIDNERLQDQDRAMACQGFTKTPGTAGSCDEYPLASSREGGPGARILEVPLREQSCQGGTAARQYQQQGTSDGVRSAVIIIHTHDRAMVRYTGRDIAKDKGAC